MLWAVIMAGGSGTRFWPLSRKDRPKQFLSFFSQKSLLEETISRISGVIPRANILVVTQKDKVSFVRKKLKLPARQVLGEPVGRNTAPCAALAAQLALQKDPQAVIALLPADHRIGKVTVFREALRVAAGVALETGQPITFGIKPKSPHTGYGYLEKAKLKTKIKGFEISHLKRFHEKPNLKKAKAFIRSGKCLWNSGIFVWKARELLEATHRYLPKVADLVQKIAKTPTSLDRNMKQLFPKMPNISIDFGLMEKMRGQILMMPVDFDWDDLGGWASYAKYHQKDAQGNIHLAKTHVVKSSGNFIMGNKRLIALLGVEDFLVVDTEDVLLICPKKQSENIRHVVSELNKRHARYL